MDTEAVSLFLALLAVVAEATVAVGVLLAIGSRFSPRVRTTRTAVVRAVGDQALGLAFVVAAVAMAGSLYFSEVADFPPCRLCWYQRICMYPLVPLLGLAAWRRDAGIRPYAAVLAGIGAVISTYHVVLERYPTLESSVCEPTNPCTLIWVRRFGYLTIPTMALSGFAVILTLLATTPGDTTPRTPS
ncbi:MAG: disulfide bond formation protein B [Acidimicrobiales bacterium]